MLFRSTEPARTETHLIKPLGTQARTTTRSLAFRAIKATTNPWAMLAALRVAMMMAGACILYAGYTLGLKTRPSVSGIVLFSYFAIAGAILSAPFAIYEWWDGSIIWPSDTGWIVIAYVTIFPSFLAQIFFLRSVDLIGPGRSGVFVNLTPIFSALFGVMLLGEAFRLYHAVALALVLLGLWWARERGSR